MQKRVPLREPYEQMLQGHMTKLKKRIAKKLKQYEEAGDQPKLRKYQREMWAIIAMKENGFEFQTVLDVHSKYLRLDLVPTHYNYPEFYRY